MCRKQWYHWCICLYNTMRQSSTHLNKNAVDQKIFALPETKSSDNGIASEAKKSWIIASLDCALSNYAPNSWKDLLHLTGNRSKTWSWLNLRVCDLWMPWLSKMFVWMWISQSFYYLRQNANEKPLNLKQTNKPTKIKRPELWRSILSRSSV